MQTILFMDSWPIYRSARMTRRWFTAEPWPGLEPQQDPLLKYSFGGPSVIREPGTGRWRMWAGGMTRLDIGDAGFHSYLYASKDGLRWQADCHGLPGTDLPHELIYEGAGSSGAAPFYDERETDPAMRYKGISSQHGLDPASRDDNGTIFTSADGVQWKKLPDAVWNKQLVDAFPNATFNPYTGKYQFTNRPILGDRRVALYQTKDWRTFEAPILVVHPDPLDEPGVEFYSMPHFFYEGTFIGFLWRQHTQGTQVGSCARMEGPVDSELTYSVNGIAWNRMGRGNFLPDRGLGREGFRSEYPTSMVLDDEGWLRVYTASVLGEHSNKGELMPNLPGGPAFLTVSRFRRDGFCALESTGDVGELLLRALIPHGGKILLNATCGVGGQIRAELRDPSGKVHPGFELEKSIPVRGDGHYLPLQWKDGDCIRDTVDSLVRPDKWKQRFMLYLEIEQSRLYAVRMDADLLYGWVPLKNLSGEIVPGICYP